MGDSLDIDSPLGDGTMPGAYSADIRGRVIARVESGSSRREAAEQFEISPSSAIKWVACYRATGSCAAKPRGGSTSPLEEHTYFLLALIEDQPDLTLDEVVCVMRKHKIAGSRTSVWRFFKRHDITFKKKPARGRAGTCRRGAGAPALDARTGYV
jgi:transposase